jgi:hypothetical protein
MNVTSYLKASGEQTSAAASAALDVSALAEDFTIEVEISKAAGDGLIQIETVAAADFTGTVQVIGVVGWNGPIDASAPVKHTFRKHDLMNGNFGVTNGKVRVNLTKVTTDVTSESRIRTGVALS